MTRSLLVLVLALLAGCGGGDDGGEADGGDAGPTREEFVAEANKICRDGEQQLTELTEQAQEKIREAQTPEEQQRAVADVLDASVEEYQPVLDRLRAVEAPEPLREEWSAFLDDIQEGFDRFPELAEATREGDRERLSELTAEFTRIASDTRPFAERNGLEDCLPDQEQ